MKIIDLVFSLVIISLGASTIVLLTEKISKRHIEIHEEIKTFYKTKNEVAEFYSTIEKANSSGKNLNDTYQYEVHSLTNKVIYCLPIKIKNSEIQVIYRGKR